MTTTDQSKSVALEFWTGLQKMFRGERPDLLPLITEDFVWRIPDSTGEPLLIGKQQAQTRLNGEMLNSYYKPEDTRLEFVTWVAEDDRVALHFTVESIMVSNGRPYKNYYMAHMRIRDGLLAECIETFDTALQAQIFTADRKPLQ